MYVIKLFFLFTQACAKVCSRSDEHGASNWPTGVEADRCFLVQSPNRVVYFHTDDAESAKTWVEKLEEARSKVQYFAILRSCHALIQTKISIVNWIRLVTLHMYVLLRKKSVCLSM